MQVVDKEEVNLAERFAESLRDRYEIIQGHLKKEHPKYMWIKRQQLFYFDESFQALNYIFSGGSGAEFCKHTFYNIIITQKSKGSTEL